MGIGLSFKVAPGVRIGLSGRGIRTSLGPRAARLHFGAGRTTVSTGAGPVTVWTGVGPRRSSSGGRRRRVSSAAGMAALQRQAAAAQRAEEIHQVMVLEQSLVSLHTEEFAAAGRPVVPDPVPPDVDALIKARRAQALEGVGLFAWSRRRSATKWAEQAGAQDARVQLQKRLDVRDELQRRLDEQWQLLLDHDPQMVHDALEDAFEDNQSPAACIDVDIDDGVRFATVLVLFGPLDMVPERRPALTPTGRPTLHKRSKSERNEFYVAALGSTVLATVREGYAVTPSVDELRVVVLRKDPQAATPDRYIEWIYAARFPRDWLADVSWSDVDPAEVPLRAPDAQMQRRGAARDVVGLPTENHPELNQMIDAVREAGELL